MSTEEERDLSEMTRVLIDGHLNGAYLRPVKRVCIDANDGAIIVLDTAGDVHRIGGRSNIPRKIGNIYSGRRMFGSR